MLRLLPIPLVLLALLVGTLHWSGGGGTQKAADFAFINRGDIYTLDLNRMSYMQDFRLTYAIREGLYSPDPKTLRPIPAGAVSHEVSDDKTVYTFHLRPGAKWSNGDPVRAQDYVFSWRRMLEEPGDYTYLFYYVRNARRYEESYAKGTPIPIADVGMTAVDDLTFKVTLDHPVTYLLELLAFPPFYPRNERSMEPFKTVDAATGKPSYQGDYTRPAKTAGGPGVVLNGPYNLVQWDYKRRLVLDRSETYWDRANVLTPRIEMVVSDNPLNQFLLYETGQVDWMADVVGELAAELREKNRPDLEASPAFGTAFLTLLCQERLPASLPPSLAGQPNPLADVRVRQALAMSIDKKYLVDNVTRMGELPARTYLPPDGTLPDFTWLAGPHDPAGPGRDPYDVAGVRGTLANLADPAGPGLPYNPEAAKRLLAEAGWANGANAAGEPFPHLPVLWNSDNPTRGRLAQVLKDQWKRTLNIDVDVQSVEGKTYHERVSKKDYVIACVAWYGDYPDASTFTDKYLSNSLQNDSDWQRPAFDALCAAAAKEGDPVARGKTLSRAEHMIDTEVPIIPMYHYVNTSLRRPWVKGIVPNPRNLTIFKRLDVAR